MYISLRLLTSVVYQPSYFNWAKVFLAKFYTPDFLPKKCSFKSKWGFTCSSSGNKSQLKLNIDEHPLHFAEGYPGIRMASFSPHPVLLSLLPCRGGKEEPQVVPHTQAALPPRCPLVLFPREGRLLGPLLGAHLSSDQCPVTRKSILEDAVPTSRTIETFSLGKKNTTVPYGRMAGEICMILLYCKMVSLSKPSAWYPGQ